MYMYIILWLCHIMIFTVYVIHIDMSIAYMYVHTRETPSLTKFVGDIDTLGGSRKVYI